MNTLVEGFFVQPTDFQLNYHSKSMFPEDNHGFGDKFNEGFDEFSPYSNGFSHVDESSSEGEISKNSSVPIKQSSPVEEFTLSEGEISEYNSVPITHSSPVEDFSSPENDPDVTVKFISQMLMEEEDLVNKPCMLHDCLALQATEKFFHDVLHNNIDENVDSPTHHFAKTTSSYGSGSSSDAGAFVGSNWNHEGDFESLMAQNAFYPRFQSNLQPAGHSGSPLWVTNSTKEWQFDEIKEDISRFLFNDDYQELLVKNERDYSLINLREKKNRDREDGDLDETQRSNKQSANNVNESEPLEMYDKVLLCPGPDSVSACVEIDAKKHLHQKQSKGSNKGKPRKSKKQGIIKEVVDLRSILMQCAQAVASYDSRTANDLLTRIRKHSSDHGDGMERLAHYFANALEARLAGTGPENYIGCFSSRISAAEVLKAYKTFITACPYRKMSNTFANRTIKRLAIGAPSLHIIDFGILYGFQWPCLIQALSERTGGPPKLRITGIDLPQPGFRPAERVLDTGNRLRKYCERFGVPFEYNAIAQKFESIKIEDLKIEKDELLVVNSIYRFHNVPDETVMQNCPRDAVLNLIRSINPNLFILGALNGTFNAPFFITRFREALFHFSSMFDMFDATVPRDDPHRLLFEQEILGKDSMNTIACEGTERVDRPETYKQWQVRNLRAGFRQVPLDREIVKQVRSKVKMDYHKDFSVDEDGKWMLQGWKGRVIHALSCWQPAN